MADKYLNLTAIQIIKAWAEGKFAADTALQALAQQVAEIIAEGGEPNTIDTISVNGTNVPPDGNKNVALTIPTATSALTNDGDGTSDFATEDYVDQNGGKIDSISVNNVPQTIDANKNVNLDLSGYQTASDVSAAIIAALANGNDPYQTASAVASAIASAVASAYKYKGSVATVADLPASGNTNGDVYDVQATGVNYAWNGTEWDALGQYVDTSVLWTSVPGQTNTLEAATVAEINSILNA